MPHFWINQLFLSPLKVCDLLRNRCAIYPGITVRFAPELLCDLTRILQFFKKAKGNLKTLSKFVLFSVCIWVPIFLLINFLPGLIYLVFNFNHGKDISNFTLPNILKGFEHGITARLVIVFFYFVASILTSKKTK